MEELVSRRTQTRHRKEELESKLFESEKLLRARACIYMTGSFGRCEAGNFSDLDLFIVGKSAPDGASLLTSLDETCVKADLIKNTRELKFPEFSGDGQYLTHYSLDRLTKALGKPEDDVGNTFTARLLLLLESSPLLEPSIYEEAIKAVIGAYWRDYDDHRSGFIPAFLVNDILRLWRTFCVNYEARSEREPPERKAKGKIKNFKLKHSRLLTCYSALLYLLAIYRKKELVDPEDAFEMTKLTPTGRLEWIRDQGYLSDVRAEIVDLLIRYDKFLQVTNVDEGDLIERFLNKETSRSYIDESYSFGDAVFRALSCLGGKTRFYRLMIV